MLNKTINNLFISNDKSLYGVILFTYIAVGTMLGFIQGGLAPILRSQGISLNSMFWVFSLYLPYGLSFLWSPWLDYLQRVANYKNQIMITQLLTASLLTLLVILSWFEVTIIYYWLIILLVNIVIASMDLALDGLSSLRSTSDNQSILSAVKVAGIACGSLIGGGGLVTAFASIGMVGVFVVMALQFLIAVPLTMTLSKPKCHLSNQSVKLLGLRVIWSDKTFRSILWRTTLLTCIIMALFNFNRILLIDLDFSLQEIGLFMGILTPIAALVVSAILPVLMKKNFHYVFKVFSASLLILLGFLIICIQSEFKSMTIWMAIGIGIMCNGFLVIIGSRILVWAKSDQSATNYSLLYGLGRLAGIFLLMVLPLIIQQVGWVSFYLVMGLSFIVAILYFNQATDLHS